MAERGWTHWARPVVVVVALLSGCSASKPAVHGPPMTPAPPRQVYVALGGPETLNARRSGDLPDDWTQVVFTETLATSAVYVNLATGRGTAADVLTVQLPRALKLRPTIVTVWLGAPDARAQTPTDAFRRDAAQLVAELRSAGVATVLLLTQPSGNADVASTYAPIVLDVARRAGVKGVTVGPVRNPFDDAGQRTIADTVSAALSS